MYIYIYCRKASHTNKNHDWGWIESNPLFYSSSGSVKMAVGLMNDQKVSTSMRNYFIGSTVMG